MQELCNFATSTDDPDDVTARDLLGLDMGTSAAKLNRVIGNSLADARHGLPKLSQFQMQ